MGLRDAALPLKERGLARRIGQEVSAALAEDRLIRTGQIPETWDQARIQEVRES
jgi:hypothetical protein